jgi:hypothetical protein
VQENRQNRNYLTSRSEVGPVSQKRKNFRIWEIFLNLDGNIPAMSDTTSPQTTETEAPAAGPHRDLVADATAKLSDPATPPEHRSVLMKILSVLSPILEVLDKVFLPK